MIRRIAMSLCSVALLAMGGTGQALAAKPRANDFPTVDRVEYVEMCIMNAPDKSRQEMLYKCSCVIDEIAKVVRYQEYVDLTTSNNSITIAGDRGAIRDYIPVRDMAKKFRSIQEKARKTCLVD